MVFHNSSLETVSRVKLRATPRRTCAEKDRTRPSRDLQAEQLRRQRRWRIGEELCVTGFLILSNRIRSLKSHKYTPSPYQPHSSSRPNSTSGGPKFHLARRAYIRPSVTQPPPPPPQYLSPSRSPQQLAWERDVTSWLRTIL